MTSPGQQPTASIIVSSYNYGRYLRRAIDSALSQTDPNVEVVVVDDGSTDDSRDVIARYADRVIPVLKENGGQASAFNAGAAVSRGAVVLFLDSDDVLLPGAAAGAVEALRDGRAAKCHWPLVEIDGRGERTGVLIPPKPLAEGDLRGHLRRHGPDSYVWPPTSGNAWSRSFIDAVFPVPEAEYPTSPDLYLSSLVPLYGEIRRLAEPQGCWRNHGKNHSWRAPLEQRLDRMLRQSDYRFEAVARRFRADGVEVDMEAWKRESWWHQTVMLTRELASLIPDGTRYVLVDDDQLGDRLLGGDEFLEGRRAVPFLERDGRYWGPPADDETAVRELERMRGEGARFVVFAWPAFWWLGHYAGFLEHLKRRHAVRQENPRAVVFELT